MQPNITRQWPWLIFFVSFGAAAQPCQIKMVDLAPALQSSGSGQVITVSGLRDIHSDEPVRRYLQVLPDGVMAVIEQKHCLMYNLTVTLMLPEGQTPEKAADLLSGILKKTVVWKKWFQAVDAAKILRDELAGKCFLARLDQQGSVALALDRKISANNENSEVLLTVVKPDSGTLPFKTIISLYVGVGGL